MKSLSCRVGAFVLAWTIGALPSSAATQVIPSPDITRDFGFGKTLAVSADFLVVGVPEAVGSGGSNQGRVHVFERGQTGWQLSSTLAAPDGDFGDKFGCSLALDGNRVLVGACEDVVSGEQAIGSAYLFEKDAASWRMVQKLRPAPSSASSGFAFALAMRGDRILIGAPWTNVAGNAAQGAVFAFERQTNTWSATQIITDPQGQAADNFGRALDMRGDVAVISAMFAPVSAEASGIVMALERGVSGWTPFQRISPSVGRDFGRELALGDSTLAVLDRGNRGRVRVYTRAGDQYLLSAEFDAADVSGPSPELESLASNGVDFFVSDSLATLRFRAEGANWTTTEVTAFSGSLAAHADELVLGRQLIEPSSGGPFLGEVRVFRGLLHLNGFESPRWTANAPEALVSTEGH
ncbi:MAG: hypothetical protein ACK5PG_09855 [Lysobacterales bacterium]|jgi:hypothetical protein